MQFRVLSRLTPVLAMLALAVAGGLLLPIAGYMAGKRLIGAYEGKLGLSDYLSSIYAAAGHGESDQRHSVGRLPDLGQPWLAERRRLRAPF